MNSPIIIFNFKGVGAPSPVLFKGQLHTENFASE